MTSPPFPACSLHYYPAYHSSGIRHPAVVRWLVIHDEEASTAASAAAWFQKPGSGGSAHLCVDDQNCYRCLPNDAIPWGAASSFGANLHGFHIELAGFASYTATQWQTHLHELERAAYKTAVHCRLFDIPVVYLAEHDLPDKRGITTHAQVTLASRRLDPLNASRYDHHDPGPAFPIAEFVGMVRRYTDGL